MSGLFVKEAFTFRNPDGSSIDVLGWGDQHYAVFESLDGFTVIKDPNTGYYHYARLSEDKRELLPTGMRVGAGDPSRLGLEPHLRANPQAIRESVRRASAATGKQRWEVRRERRRTALQRALEAEGTQAGPQPAPPSEPRTGTYVGLCILIQFPDVTGTITREDVSDFCNQQGYNGHGNNGSVYDYFFDNSGGRLEYTNIVTSYYTAKQNRSYYTDPTVAYGTRTQELIREALDDLKSQNYDFSQLSSDSEGYVYALNIFYAGVRVNSYREGLWPYSDALDPTYDAGNGKTFCDYQISNMGSQLTLGTFCHENGHMLCDFPDLYDHGLESYGAGRYCLMASGDHNIPTNPAEICAYLKAQAGWAVQVTSLSPGLASVPAGQNVFFKQNNPTKFTEYFIIQNRQQQGRDTWLPSAGLVIWHVDELGSNDDEQMSPSQHYECALEQADGNLDLEKNLNPGDNADLFASPAATQFSYDTSPNANWWNGNPSGVMLSQISPPAETMTFVQAGFQRQGDSGNQAGVVREIALAKHQSQQVVTAVQTESGTLGLISWRVGSDGSVSRTCTAGRCGQAGAASYIDIAGSSSIAGGSRYVTACRTGSGTLELISWDISDDGMTITRVGDSKAQAGIASHIKIVMLSESLFVTACRTQSGTLKLISWRLNPNGSISRCPGGGGDAGAVSEIALTAIPSGDGGGHVITSVRAGNGNLLLIVWAVSPSGMITRLGSGQAGGASMIRSVLDNYGHVVTSVCAGNGSLLLIIWEIANNGNTVRRLSDSSNKAGEIGSNALMARPNGVVSAVRSAEGTLLLIGWEIGPLGEISRVFDSRGQAGEASLITLCEQSLDGEFPIVTAVRAGNGSLLLITWAEYGL